MAERQGVEIEYCPVCRGVWLDRGELDKIIERSNAYIAANEADLATMRRDAARAEPEKVKRDEAGYRRDDDRRDARFDLDLDGGFGDRDRYERRDRDYRDRDDDDYRGDSRNRKKKGFLGDLFDIFD